MRRLQYSLSRLSLLSSEDATPPKPLDAEVEANETTEYELKETLTDPSELLCESTYICVDTAKSLKMLSCPTCQKHLTEEVPANCANCVTTLLYDARLSLAKVLLEKEPLQKIVEAIVGPEPIEPLGKETASLRRAWQRQQEIVEDQQVREEEEEMRQELVRKQKLVEERRSCAQELRARLEKKRANLAIAKGALARHSKQREEALEKNGDKLKIQYDAQHSKSIETRAILCRESASLLKLSHLKKKKRDGTIKDRHYIAGLLLPDLKEINNMRCTDLTAALSNVTRLIFNCAFYLAIRLPAEITLPHRDYPFATINTPPTSYLGQRINFPGSGSNLSTPSSPSASRMESALAPKPRPLYIDSDDHNESVAQFAKKEPVAFNYFIEGVSLLAWDVAWLSRTQGFVAGTDTWEDICDMGRILYQMLLAQPPSAAIARVLTQRDVQNGHHRSPSTSSRTTNEKETAFPARLGSYSHDSAHTFLGSAAAAGNNPSRSWRLNNHAMISDPLRKHLLTEMNNAEWELLDEGEWDDGAEKMDDAVVIKARNMDGKEYDEARSIMVGGGEEEGGARASSKGKSGWTKLKNRDKP